MLATQSQMPAREGAGIVIVTEMRLGALPIVVEFQAGLWQEFLAGWLTLVEQVLTIRTSVSQVAICLRLKVHHIPCASSLRYDLEHYLVLLRGWTKRSDERSRRSYRISFDANVSLRQFAYFIALFIVSLRQFKVFQMWKIA